MQNSPPLHDPIAPTREHPVGRALAYIEAHLSEPLSLEEIAAVAGYSPYHFHRMFAGATGLGVARYVRGRRLTEAAYRLIGTEDAIVQVALGSGFESQEAFTRAFRTLIGAPPGRFRGLGIPPADRQPAITLTLDDNQLTGANTMQPTIATLDASIHAVGMEVVCADPIADAGKPGVLWGAFAPRHREANPRQGGRMLGISICTERLESWAGNEGQHPVQTAPFVYAAVVEVDQATAAGSLPKGMKAYELPAGQYAVFTHEGHVSKIRETLDYIWGTWLPASGERPADGPDFEVYDERFDPMTGNGAFDVYVPLAKKA